MNDKWLHLIILSIILLFLGCGRSDKEEDDTIIVGYLPIIAHLPAFIAEAEGYLDGINVEFRVFPTSNDLMGALIDGSIHISTTVATAPYLAQLEKLIEEGNEIPAYLFSISRMTSNNPFDGVFVKKDSDINDLSDLEGRRVGVFPGSTAKNILGYVLDNNFDVNTNSIKWVMLPPATQIDALIHGEIDVLYTYETVRTIASNHNLVRQIYGSIVSTAQEGSPYGSSAVGREFLNNKSDVAMAFIEAFDKGIMVVRDRPERARTILRARLGIPNIVAENCNLEYRITSKEMQEEEIIRNLFEFSEILKNSGELTLIRWNVKDIIIPLE